jgi:LemA protein
MGVGSIVLFVVLGVVAVVVLWAIAVFNRLVTLKNQVKNSWAQIDVQLQRRYDLIPNLVETAKGYMNFERGTLESVIQARNQAAAAREYVAQQGGPTESSLKGLLSAEANLGGALGRIFAIVEAYPNLRASEPLMKLQEELSSTENKVAFSRQAYNDQAMNYNVSQQRFPAALLAGMFGHHIADLYEVENAEVKKAPKVSF